MVLKVLSLMPWLGYGGYPWLGTALFLLLGTPFWFQGIIPCLLLKILLVKGALLLGPPIALGAFVLGQGSGLLIGKLLGIKLVLTALSHHRQAQHGGKFKYNHWKFLDDAGAGWKGQRIRLRLPFLLKWRLHPTFPPSPHYDFYSFPPIRHIKYTHKPYGTYKYSQPGWTEGQNHVMDSSDWLDGPGPEYSTSGASTHARVLKMSRHEARRDGEPNAFGAEPLSQGRYNFSSSHKESLSENDAIYGQPSKTSSSEEEGVILNSLRSEVENFIRAEIYKLKSAKREDGGIVNGEAEDEVKELINKQFARDLLESVQTSSIPAFVPFPAKTGNITEKPETKDNEESMTSFVFSTILSSMQDLNPINFLPQPLVSWLSPTISKSSKESKENDVKKRQTRSTTNKIKVDQLTHSVVNDIRNLFSIISFLDISRCLEKMVCEIHGREKEFTRRHLTNSYEGNIIIAFRIMESLVGNDEDRNIVKYRAAARLGQKHHAPEICLKKFPNCPISSNQLISLGSIVTHAQQSSG